MDMSKLPAIMENAQALKSKAEALEKIKSPTKEDIPKVKEVVVMLEQLEKDLKETGLPKLFTMQIEGHIKKIKKLETEWKQALGE